MQTLKRKTIGNVFLGHLGESVFHIFLKLQSIIGGVCPQYLLEFLWIILQDSIQSLWVIPHEIVQNF